MKRTKLLSILLALCLLLTACGAEASNEADTELYRSEVSVAETTAAETGLVSDGAELTSTADTDRKLIKTVELEAETEHYDELAAALEEQIDALGGYTEERQTGKYGRSRRWSEMTIRIPAEHLDQFLTHMNENSNVLSTSETTEDVTLQYVDTEAKITALETEQTRLLELLSQAQNLSEILEIEDRLSDVTYELERYESRKRSYDNQVTYATVYLRLEEVEVLTPVEEPTVWERISTGFLDSLEGVSTGIVDLFVYLVAGSPYIVVCGAVLALIIALARKQSRKGQKTKQAPPSQTP